MGAPVGTLSLASSVQASLRFAFTKVCGHHSKQCPRPTWVSEGIWTLPSVSARRWALSCLLSPTPAWALS